MLNSILTFVALTFTAMVVENALFSRALATSKALILVRIKKELFLFGGSVTVMTTLSSLLSWVANYFTRQLGWNFQLRAVAFLCCICVVYQVLCAAMVLKWPKEYEQLKDILSLSALNSAVFGSLIISSMQNYSLAGTIGYGLGTGIGLTISLILVYVGRKNLAMSNVPKVFKGLPIVLIYIGILSLAIYGLIGHQLPS